MKILRMLFLLIVVVIAVVLCMAALKPNTFHVERSALIPAAPDAVFATVNDFHRWPAWSPWEKIDPAMKTTYGGADRGKDATYAWVGNDKAGEGKMTITESAPASHIGIQLDFIKPFAASNQVGFDFKPEGEGTRVTWSMDGASPFMMKVITVFMNMDQTIGKDFEKGLAALPAAVEGTPVPAASDSAAAH